MASNQLEALDYTKILLNWRKSKEVIHSGKLKHFIPEDNVYVYFRYNKNKGEENYQLHLERFSEITSKYKTAEEIISKINVPLIENLEIKSGTVTIFELK